MKEKKLGFGRRLPKEEKGKEEGNPCTNINNYI